MTTTAPPQTSSRLARVITEVLAPWVIVLVLPLAVAWHATSSVSATLLWGTIVALTSSILPMLVIVWGARRGRWDGHHVRDRGGRLIPFLALIVLTGIGLALLIALHAPWPVIGLDIAQVISLIVTGAITVKWKISMHTAVAAGAVFVLTITYSPVVLVGLLAVAAIGWSRVALGDHTTAQVTVGAVVGGVVGGSVFAALIGLT